MKTRLLIISLLMAIGIFANAQSHYIGEIVTAPDGQQGIVFYVSNDGQDYWLVALNDLPQSYAWGDLTDIPDLENVDDSFFIHYNPCGYDATTAMKDYQDNNPNYAASAVNTKQFWCIPSTGQASKLYAAMPYIQHLFAQNGGIAPGINHDYYWTSTERSYNQAYIIYLGVTNYQGGAISTAYKDEFLGVRPIWCQPCTNELPSVGQIVAPDEICSGSSLTLDAPETQNADNGGWQIAPDADFSNCQEYQGEALDESFDGWYLRYFASNHLGTVYSNTVQITVLQSPTSSFEISTCGSYTWNNETYTESGTYQQFFPMPNSCDSVATCYLTIWPSYTNTYNITSCDSYTWNDNTYTQSGDYEQAFTSQHGCDSIVTKHITINHSTNHEFIISTCDSFSWNGTEYTESGDYEQVFTSSVGCDSIVTLHLTIETFEEMQAIEGDVEVDSYLTPSSVYNQPGFMSGSTFQWIIEPAEAGTLTPNGGFVLVNWSPEFIGTATLKVIVSNACGEGENEISVNVRNTFGINENNINAKIYPNPTSGFINIEVAGMQRITVINTLGQVVTDGELEADTTSIDMTQFGKGLFVIRIQTKDGSCTRRIEVK